MKFASELQGNDSEISAAVESGKKNFVGSELPSKTLGVIGLGAIGLASGQRGTVTGHEGRRLRSADLGAKCLAAFQRRAAGGQRGPPVFADAMPSRFMSRWSMRHAASSTPSGSR